MRSTTVTASLQKRFQGDRRGSHRAQRFDQARWSHRRNRSAAKKNDLFGHHRRSRGDSGFPWMDPIALTSRTLVAEILRMYTLPFGERYHAIFGWDLSRVVGAERTPDGEQHSSLGVAVDLETKVANRSRWLHSSAQTPGRSHLCPVRVASETCCQPAVRTSLPPSPKVQLALADMCRATTALQRCLTHGGLNSGVSVVSIRTCYRPLVKHPGTKSHF